jgi:hypothetical protein
MKTGDLFSAILEHASRSMVDGGRQGAKWTAVASSHKADA